MTQEPIQAGYRAFNGYIFNAKQAESYNRAQARAVQNPTEANLNGAHNLFMTIITTPASNRAATLERSLFWQRHVLSTAQTIEQETRARAAIASLESALFQEMREASEDKAEARREAEERGAIESAAWHDTSAELKG
jgi:hypothetical protein